MISETTFTRQISKKLKLTKKTIENYKRSNLNFFPENFQFNKPVLILSEEIILHYQSILLCSQFDYLICSFLVNSIEQERKMKKRNKNIIWFKDQFVEEISQKSLESTSLLLTSYDYRINRLSCVLQYLKNNYKKGNFEILSIENLYKITKTPFPDIIFSVPNREIINSLVNGQGGQLLCNLLKSNNEVGCIYEPYLDNLEFHHKAGVITKGTLMISSINNSEGEVIEKDKRIRIFGKNLNRAMHGDEVFVQDNKIVGLYKTKSRIVVGTLFKIENFTNEIFIGTVRPIDRRINDIKIYTFMNGGFLNRKVVVDILEWNTSQELPYGVVVKVLGLNGNFEDEIQAVLEHSGVNYYTEEWIDTIKRLGGANEPGIGGDDKAPESLGFDKFSFSTQKAVEDLQNGRKDLRHLDICSIDPAGCTDIDDALHCIEYNDYIEVGVHIADVSFYVTPDSILDIEAKNRSTTVYLPDRRIDMLPPFLSSDLCSLVEHKDRAAFSCIWKFDKEFNVIDYDITKSLINSKASLSYEQAYDIIRCGSNDPIKSRLKKSIVSLLNISNKLRSNRFNNGALELNSDELYFDKNRNIKIKEHIPTHSLVEEFMLLANITIAKFIHHHNPEYSLLRKHPLPSAIEIDCVDSTSSKTLNISLSKFNEDKQTILKRVITRSMQQAIYFSSGESSDFYHYGLAIPIYTHFTSPIRRYPDIIVHRTVAYILENQDDKLDLLRVSVDKESCSLMNFRHRNAQNCGRMAEDLTLASVINSVDLQASVVANKETGIVVFIKQYGIEGFIKTDGKYNLFDTITVHLESDFNKFCIDRQFQISIVN